MARQTLKVDNVADEVGRRFSPLGPLGIVLPVQSAVEFSLAGGNGVLAGSDNVTAHDGSVFFFGVDDPLPLRWDHFLGLHPELNAPGAPRHVSNATRLS
jgi:hypothetical protein